MPTQTYTVQNPECGGAHCITGLGEVRVLPTGGDSNAILCRACYHHELAWRRFRNHALSPDCQFALPAWETLKVYEP